MVVSYKLDWTTLDWSSILPHASVSQKLPYASTNSATIHRIGNLCFFECSSRFTFSNVPGGGGDADETVPSGFRPKFVVHTNIASPMQTASMMLTFNVTGSIVFWTGYSVNNLLLAGTATWWTDDPWPTN